MEHRNTQINPDVHNARVNFPKKCKKRDDARQKR